MYTKSIIQQQTEIINAKSNFREGLMSLMEKYNIEDSVFVYNGKNVQEVCEGYFEILNNYDTLNEAIRECDITTSGIRINYNPETKTSSYQVGKVCKHLNECKNSNKILDIDRLKYINE